MFEKDCNYSAGIQSLADFALWRKAVSIICNFNISGLAGLFWFGLLFWIFLMVMDVFVCLNFFVTWMHFKLLKRCDCYSWEDSKVGTSFPIERVYDLVRWLSAVWHFSRDIYLPSKLKLVFWFFCGRIGFWTRVPWLITEPSRLSSELLFNSEMVRRCWIDE